MVADAITHIVTVVLISGSIVLVGAIVLHPEGIAIKAPDQLGDLLCPSLGNATPIVMGIAIIGAGFFSLLGNTQRGFVLLNAGLNKDTGLESKPVKILCLACLAVATIICFAYGGSPTQRIFIANVATSIATPVAGLFYGLRLIIGDRKSFIIYLKGRLRYLGRGDASVCLFIFQGLAAKFLVVQYRYKAKGHKWVYISAISIRESPV